MNKTVRKVFLIIGVLVLCLVIWVFVFGNGLKFLYNAIRAPFNNAWNAITGTSEELLPEWSDESAKIQTNIDEINGMN